MTIAKIYELRALVVLGPHRAIHQRDRKSSSGAKLGAVHVRDLPARARDYNATLGIQCHLRGAGGHVVQGHLCSVDGIESYDRGSREQAHKEATSMQK